MCGNSSSNPIDKWLTLSISHVGLYKNLISSNNGFSEFIKYSGTGAYLEFTNIYIYIITKWSFSKMTYCWWLLYLLFCTKWFNYIICQ